MLAIMSARMPTPNCTESHPLLAARAAASPNEDTGSTVCAAAPNRTVAVHWSTPSVTRWPVCRTLIGSLMGLTVVPR